MAKYVSEATTNDPESWGMCCSKEMALDCEAEYYRRRHRLFNFDEWSKDDIKAFIVCALILAAGIGFIFLNFYVEKNYSYLFEEPDISTQITQVEMVGDTENGTEE